MLVFIIQPTYATLLLPGTLLGAVHPRFSTACQYDTYLYGQWKGRGRQECRLCIHTCKKNLKISVCICAYRHSYPPPMILSACRRYLGMYVRIAFKGRCGFNLMFLSGVCSFSTVEVLMLAIYIPSR